MKRENTSWIGPLCFSLLILISGVSIAALVAVKTIPSLLMEADRGLLPDGFEATMPTDGEYTVWLHMSGRLGEKLYTGTGKLPPGGKVFLFDAASGRQVELKKTVSAEKNMGEDQAVSLGVFESERAGQVIELKGSGLNTPVLISLAHTSSGQIMKIVLMIVAIVLVSLIVAMLVLVKMTRKRRTAAVS